MDEENSSQLKKCSKCQETIQIEYFHSNKSKSDGLSTECKSCCIVNNRTSYNNNKEKIIAQAKGYRDSKKESISKKNKEYHLVNRDSNLEYMKVYRDNNPDKLLGYKYSRYNITYAEYLVMLEDQNNVCRICLENCPTGKRLSVDHCHITGIVRGLLCTRCNMGLGYFKDNEDLLLEAIEYLRRSK